MQLLGDIGGTHARFALTDGAAIHHAETFRAGDFATLKDALLHYTSAHQVRVTHAALSIAATLIAGQDQIELVNHPAWNFSARDLKQDLGLGQLLLLNDFEALAHAIPHLSPPDLHPLHPGTAIPNTPIAILGPGTGLGMAGLIPIDGRYHVLPSEGGNASLPIPDARGFTLIEAVRRQEGQSFISAEDILSGPGLLRLYRAIVAVDGGTARYVDAADVADAGLKNLCPAAAETLDLFCHWLGVVAGDLALTLQSTGGVYLCGGILPQWGDGFRTARFRAGFTNKGPYADYVARIPVYAVMHPYPALEGLRIMLLRDK